MLYTATNAAVQG